MTIKAFKLTDLTHLQQLKALKSSRVLLTTSTDTTPSYGMIKEANSYCHEQQVSTTVMIQPRQGNFVYNDLELRAMEEDILKAIELEADSLALGLLTEDKMIDIEAIESLLPATQGLPLVFNQAFNAIPEEKQPDAITSLKDLGFTHILGQETEKEISIKEL